ncbi:hypothetical protein [Myxosarcina sp. GI1]|uniref:hypothetical protein n=1 Tax=Myxosarcina sp. GI1 TaxID=1541065 RepID=UPI00068A0775|nr:hypothetical protein [Myxosarcina sp. GI1]
MKKIIFSGLATATILLFNATATSTKAQGLENATDRVQQGSEYSEKRISPFSLVSAAYRGRFENWNIPGYERLESSYQNNKVTAKDLVNAGIEAGELSPQAANDEGYINSVDAQLNDLSVSE